MPTATEAYNIWVEAAKIMEAADAALQDYQALAAEYTNYQAAEKAAMEASQELAEWREQNAGYQQRVAQFDAAKAAREAAEQTFKALALEAAAKGEAPHEAIHNIILRPSVDITDDAAAVAFLLPINPKAVTYKLGETKKVLLACREWLADAKWVTFTETPEVQIKKDYKP